MNTVRPTAVRGRRPRLPWPALTPVATLSATTASALTSNRGPGRSWMLAERIADLLAADAAGR